MSKKKLKRNISGYFEPFVEKFARIAVGDEVHTVSIGAEKTKLYIKEVKYNDPMTIVLWSDGTKTVSKIHGGDKYSKETGLTLCVLKKFIGATEVHNLVEDWVKDDMDSVKVSDVRKFLRATN